MDNHELSYYEYWLTKDVWSAVIAIRLMVDYYRFDRSWYESEDPNKSVNKYHDILMDKLAYTTNSNMFADRAVHLHEPDENYVYHKKVLVLDETALKPKEYILWLVSEGYKVPYEFEVFIGTQEKVDTLNQRQQDTIDKESCKRIAQTLWDNDPNMTIEDIVNHKAILVYGSGKLHENMLRRWVSQVDPREKKRGRKKLSQ